MKKLFLLIVASAILHISNAQEFGLKAGLNLSSQSTNLNSENLGYRLGYQLGFAIKVDLGNQFTFNPGLGLTTKGFKDEVTYHKFDNQGNVSGFMTDKVDVKFNYIVIPLNFGYTFDLGKVKPMIQAGPYFSFLTGGKYKIYHNDELYKEESINTEDVNQIDLGLNFGGGVEIGQFQILANYAYGLSNQLKNPRQDYYIHNKSMEFTLLYFFKE